MWSWLLTFVVDFLWGKLVAFLAGIARVAKKREDIKQKAEESVVPMEKAETKEEIDDAADDMLNGL